MNYKKTLVVAPAYYQTLPTGAKWLLESAELHGIEVDLIGLGEPYKNNFDAKISRFLPVVQAKTGYDYIVMVDACDTLFATDLAELHFQFAKIGKPFVMAAERNCFPNAGLAKRHPNHNRLWRFLNSGFYFAEWSEFLRQSGRLLASRAINNERYRTNRGGSDQGVWMQAWLDREVDLQLDYDTRLCCCMTHCCEQWADCLNPDFHWGKRIYNKREDVWPCIFHFNGLGRHFHGGVKAILQQ